MRIVLKPLGFLSIVVALIALTALAFQQEVSRKNQNIAASETAMVTPPVTTPQRGRDPQGNGGISNPVLDGGLANGSFEEPFVTARYLGEKAPRLKLTGEIAQGWCDNSEWADVDVHYALEKDPAQVEDGKSCQRMEIGAVRAGGAQMVQTIRVTPGRKWRAVICLKASREITAGFGISQLNRKGTVIKMTSVKLGTKWQQAQMDFSSPTDVDLFIVNCFESDVTIWVDAASLKPLPK